MKNTLITSLSLAAFVVSISAAAADLRVDIAPQFNGAPLVFDVITNPIASGQKISVTRLDFLLSEFSLRRPDGTWIGNKRFFAFISPRDGRTNFTLNGIPPGNYSGIRFHIGLEPKVNHGSIAQWPSNHPLNPDVDHLYWGWSKEYIFLALEGGWRNDAEQIGFSYHLATDPMLMTVELPVALNLGSSREIRLGLDVAKMFSTPNKIALSGTTDSTHSRTNDLLAVQLRENVEHSFTVENVTAFSPFAVISDSTHHIEIGPDATPYRFTIASYFPQPNLPRDNPLTVQGVALGRKLFFDRRLSGNNMESCATCHNPKFAFAQPQKVSRGANGDLGTRNAMSLENLAWKDSFFWDGRAASVRQQVLQPIQNPIEMDESLTDLVAKLSGTGRRPVVSVVAPQTVGVAAPQIKSRHPGSISTMPLSGATPDRTGEPPVPPDTNDYPQLFNAAFGSPKITPDRIARALEQFVLTRVSFNSKFDHVVEGTAKFTKQEERGFILFNTEYDPYHGQHGADCFHCHGGPTLQSLDFANNGLDSTFKDPGRYNVTKRAGDMGKFAVPSLRNVAVTGPYMHDGRFKTLDEVVEHYCTGTKRSATLDPNLAKHPDGGVPLSGGDKKALVAFLKTLTDERFLPPATPASVAQK